MWNCVTFLTWQANHKTQINFNLYLVHVSFWHNKFDLCLISFAQFIYSPKNIFLREVRGRGKSKYFDACFCLAIDLVMSKNLRGVWFRTHFSNKSPSVLWKSLWKKEERSSTIPLQLLFFLSFWHKLSYSLP